MNEHRPDNVAWLMEYTRALPRGERRIALARYERALRWLATWETNPDAGYFRLWNAIVEEDPHAP